MRDRCASHCATQVAAATAAAFPGNRPAPHLRYPPGNRAPQPRCGPAGASAALARFARAFRAGTRAPTRPPLTSSSTASASSAASRPPACCSTQCAAWRRASPASSPSIPSPWGCCRAARLADALDVLRRAPVRPNERTYSILIDGACKSREPEFGVRLLVGMLRDGLFPSVPKYSCLLDGLCTAGNLKHGG
ncbi:hypothetical protein ACP70R_031430 [Stipagrostis hirtigluma subsp. patula]